MCKNPGWIPSLAGVRVRVDFIRSDRNFQEKKKIEVTEDLALVRYIHRGKMRGMHEMVKLVPQHINYTTANFYRILQWKFPSQNPGKKH